MPRVRMEVNLWADYLATIIALDELEECKEVVFDTSLDDAINKVIHDGLWDMTYSYIKLYTCGEKYRKRADRIKQVNPMLYKAVLEYYIAETGRDEMDNPVHDFEEWKKEWETQNGLGT